MARDDSRTRSWPVPGRPSDPVRLYPPPVGGSSWRIRYRDHLGAKRERTRNDPEAAALLAEGMAAELGHILVHGPKSLAPIRDADDWYRGGHAKKKNWAPKYRSERSWVHGLVEGYHPGFFEMPCPAFDNLTVARILNAADEAGHPLGTEHYRRVGAYLSGLFNTGAKGGWFAYPTDPRLHPMHDNPYNVGKGRRRSGEDPKPTTVRPVREDEIPSRQRIEALAVEAERLTGRWWEGFRFRFMAGSGVRLGEGVVLTVADVTDEHGHVDDREPMVHVTKQAYEVDREHATDGRLFVTDAVPKWDSVRWAFYDPELVPAVRRRVQEIRDEAGPTADISGRLLFPSPTGGVARPRNVRNRLFNPAADAAGWPVVPATRPGGKPKRRWTPHSTRHTYATWLLRTVGAPVKVVADFLGHTDSTFTEQRYGASQQDSGAVAMRAWRASRARDRLAADDLSND